MSEFLPPETLFSPRQDAPANAKHVALSMQDPRSAHVLLDAVLSAEASLIALHSPLEGIFIDRLMPLARQSGQSIYHWVPDRGLVSLREGQIVVQGSKRLADALRYIAQAAHFGIYFFTDFASHLSAQSIAQLRQISRTKAQHERKVVLLAEHMRLPEMLGEACFHLLHVTNSNGRLRLRNGIWVQ
jgi:alpha-ketoglutarate-dependent taurine dioxygenase